MGLYEDYLIRHRSKNTPLNISKTYSKCYPSHNKNSVLLSNLEYNFEDNVSQPFQKVENTRTKLINLQGDETNSFNRFMEKHVPVKNEYYLLCDLETDISDEYHLHNNSFTGNKVQHLYNTVKDTSNLDIGIPNVKEPLCNASTIQSSLIRKL